MKRTKNTEEKERKRQCSIRHNETHIFKWFYIPKGRLLLISEGTLISISITGIKHYAWCNYQSTLHFEI